jgi:hypothetical protein
LGSWTASARAPVFRQGFIDETRQEIIDRHASRGLRRFGTRR